MKKGIKGYRKRCALFGTLGLAAIGSFFMAPVSAKEVRAGEDIFQVLFPANTDHVFDFIMDPQELISKTDAAAYGGLTFEEGATLFFRRHDGGAEEDYSSSSDALVITNRGTEEVDIVLTASVSPDSLEKIHMTDDKTFTDDTGASLYLALTDGEQTIAIDREEGAVIHTTLEGVSGEDSAYREYRFWLMGAVNSNGDWSEVNEAVPKVTVTWSVLAEEETETEKGAGRNEDTEPDKRSEESETGENLKETEEPETGENLKETEEPKTGEQSKAEEQPDQSKMEEPKTEEQPEESKTEEQPEEPVQPKAGEQPETPEEPEAGGTP